MSVNCTITFRGNTICFSDQGEGEVVVLLHGWRLCKETWRRVAHQLVAEGYRCITIDLPGFGKSSLQAPVNSTFYADGIEQVLARRQVRNCTMLGHSFGGKCAIAFAARHPVYVNMLILCDVSMGGPKSTISWWRRMVRMFLLLGLPPTLKETYVQTHRRSYADDLRHVQAPVRLIYGRYDTLTPPRCGHAIRQVLPTASIQIINWAWHTPYIERNQLFMRRLLALLRKN